MKPSFIIFLISLFFLQKIEAQDTIKKSKNYINPEEVRYGKYLYRDEIINERELHTLLLNTNDEKIMSLVQQSQKAKKNQRIGFAAIPAGLGALISIAAFSYKSAAYHNSQSYAQTHQLTKSEQDNLNGLLVASAIFAGAGIYICIQAGINGNKELKLNRKAIKLYNQKY